MEQRKLSVIFDDITILRRQIRRAEDDGVNWRQVRAAKERLAELESELVQARKRTRAVAA